VTIVVAIYAPYLVPELEGVWAAAFGAAAGSIAGQFVGNILGIQDGFDWKAVAIAAVTAGLTEGMVGKGGWVADVGTTPAGIAARAAVNTAVNQGLRVIAYRGEHFSWRNVAVSALAAYAGAEVSDSIGIDQYGGEDSWNAVRSSGQAGLDFGNTFEREFGSGMMRGMVTAMFSGGRATPQGILTDVFGNALGTALGSYAVATGQQERALERARSASQGQGLRPTSTTRFGPEFASERSTPSWQSPDYSLAAGGPHRFPSYSPDVPNGPQELPDQEPAAPTGPRTVRAGDYGGALERVARAQLGPDATTREVNNYVGQLFELNGMTNARAIQPDQMIILPDATSPAATKGLALYGKDIAFGEQQKADLAARREAEYIANSDYRETRRGLEAAAAANRAATPSVVGDVSMGSSMSSEFGDFAGEGWDPQGGVRFLKTIVGAAEIVGAGVWNLGVKAASGVGAIPYAIYDGPEAGAAVVEGMKERFSYTPRSEGAQMISAALAPVGQEIQRSIVNPVRAYSESVIGDGATSILGGALEAGGDILAVYAGGRALQSFVDNSVFVVRPMSQLNGGVPVPLLDESIVRITTITDEMRDAYRGMGYLDPRTNTFRAAPLDDVMAVDHIYPASRIAKEEGFNTLTKGQMTDIIQDRIGLGNLQPLPQSLNASKKDLFGDWTTYNSRPLNADYVRALTETQEVMRARILEQIRIYQQQNRMR